jgi:murein endopeptidase
MPRRISWLVAAFACVLSAASVNAQQGGRNVISTPAAPNAIGRYLQGIQVGKTLYVSGEIAIDPKTN